ETGERTGLAVIGPAAPTESGWPARLVAVASAARFRSAVLPLEFPATHLGFQWEADGPASADLVLAARTSVDGHDWSPWATVAALGGCEGGPGQPVARY